MLADLAYATTIRPTRRSRTHMRRLTRIQHSVTNIATSAFDGPSATAELFFCFFFIWKCCGFNLRIWPGNNFSSRYFLNGSNGQIVHRSQLVSRYATIPWLRLANADENIMQQRMTELVTNPREMEVMEFKHHTKQSTRRRHYVDTTNVFTRATLC